MIIDLFKSILGVTSQCPFQESDGNNVTKTTTPIIDLDLINLTSNYRTLFKFINT